MQKAPTFMSCDTIQLAAFRVATVLLLFLRLRGNLKPEYKIAQEDILYNYMNPHLGKSLTQ